MVHYIFRILTTAANITHTYMALNQIHGELLEHMGHHVYTETGMGKRLYRTKMLIILIRGLNELGIVPKVKLVFQLGFYGSLA